MLICSQEHFSSIDVSEFLDERKKFVFQEIQKFFDHLLTRPHKDLVEREIKKYIENRDGLVDKLLVSEVSDLIQNNPPGIIETLQDSEGNWERIKSFIIENWAQEVMELARSRYDHHSQLWKKHKVHEVDDTLEGKEKQKKPLFQEEEEPVEESVEFSEEVEEPKK
jgi:hypothetical protein